MCGNTSIKCRQRIILRIEFVDLKSIGPFQVNEIITNNTNPLHLIGG